MLHSINLLEELTERSKDLNKLSVEKALVLFEVERFFIGDTCDRMAYLKVCSAVFPNAKVDLFTNQPGIAHLMKNNIYVNYLIISEAYSQINFPQYDIVICLSHKESDILSHLNGVYEKQGDSHLPKVYSIPDLNDKNHGIKIIFPPLPITTEEVTADRMEIFISKTEARWANQWLRNAGVGKEDSVVIFLDSAGDRSKLMSTSEQFELIKQILKYQEDKILIYDENGMNKKLFYISWLGAKIVADRFIFAEKSALRESICLMAADAIRMIIGPCTGLMHCASAVYQHMLSANTRKENEVPVLLTYRGKVQDPIDSPYRWWGNSLCDCALIVASEENGKRIRELSEQDREMSNALNGLLPAQEITGMLLYSHIQKQYKNKLKQQ